MNTGHGSRSHFSHEAFPFAAEVYKPLPAARTASELDELRSELRAEVRALRAHVSQVARSQDFGREVAAIRAAIEDLVPAAATPPKRGGVAALVKARGIEGIAAAKLASRGKEVEGTANAKARAALAEVLPMTPWTVDAPGRRIVAAVGPAGVGKTTTIAKLAAAARAAGRSVSLVSCDSFRVGAIDQLERYAELIDADFHVARTAAELAEVLDVEDADVVFVDTSGRPPTATAPEAALAARRKKDADVTVEVILCVPASIRAADASRVAAVFGPLAITSVCVTKTDETTQPAGLVHGPLAARRPLSLVCNGPRVPEDVSAATLEVVASALGIPADDDDAEDTRDAAMDGSATDGGAS